MQMFVSGVFLTLFSGGKLSRIQRAVCGRQEESLHRISCEKTSVTRAKTSTHIRGWGRAQAAKGSLCSCEDRVQFPEVGAFIPNASPAEAEAGGSRGLTA